MVKQLPAPIHPMPAAAAAAAAIAKPSRPISVNTSASSHHLETGPRLGTLIIQLQVHKLYTFSNGDDDDKQLGFSRRTFSDELLFPQSVLTDPSETLGPFTKVFNSAKVDPKHWTYIVDMIFTQASNSHLPNTRQQLGVVVKIEIPETEPNIHELRHFRVVEDDATTTDNNKCSICLKKLSFGGQSLTETTHCFHVFHSSCLHKWLTANDSCPLCRRRVVFGS